MVTQLNWYNYVLLICMYGHHESHSFALLSQHSGHFTKQNTGDRMIHCVRLLLLNILGHHEQAA